MMSIAVMAPRKPVPPPGSTVCPQRQRERQRCERSTSIPPWRVYWLREALDQIDKIVTSVTPPSSQREQFGRLGHDDPVLGFADDADPSPSPKLQYAFITQDAQGPQDRIGMDPHDLRHVTSRREAPAGANLARNDVSANLGRHLLVQRQGAIRPQLDSTHGNTHHSTI